MWCKKLLMECSAFLSICIKLLHVYMQKLRISTTGKIWQTILTSISIISLPNYFFICTFSIHHDCTNTSFKWMTVNYESHWVLYHTTGPSTSASHNATSKLHAAAPKAKSKFLCRFLNTKQCDTQRLLGCCSSVYISITLLSITCVYCTETIHPQHNAEKGQ